MQTTLVNMTYEIQIGEGEKLVLPQSLIENLRPGRWVVMIRPAAEQPTYSPIRDHQAFLNGYAPEDEGLYDDYSAG